jgi:hypothetical protein
MLTDHLIDEHGNRVVAVGDEVETDDVRFFVGSINDSQRLCFIDKTKPWTLKNELATMARCIRGGDYGVATSSLKRI